MGDDSKSALLSANDHAAAAAAAVQQRHLRRLYGMPGTRNAIVAWPIGFIKSYLGFWHYWWHAHLVDLYVDAAIHRPGDTPRRSARPGDDRSYDPAVAATANQLLRGIRGRNLGRWTNNYYDDMAWLGLAIERADRHLGLSHDAALRTLTARMTDSWVPQLGGGIPWRTMDLFFNAPANGPAAILVARTGHIERAVAMCDWMDANLIDPASHLVIDGVKPGPAEGMERVTAIYSYCQGVVLGAELEVLRRTGDTAHLDRIERLLGAVEIYCRDDRIIPGAGGGDGGLFAGVLARYLALIATDLPDVAGAPEIRRRAAAIVTTSADAAWAHRTEVDGLPLFGADWRTPATVPSNAGQAADFIEGAVNSSEIPERDLSVQLSGWMVLEAAAAIDLGLPEHVQKVTP